jgi:hypothetical protein
LAGSTNGPEDVQHVCDGGGGDEVTTTVMSKDLVTPVADVAVTLREKVPTAADAEAWTVTVANAKSVDPDGMMTCRGDSANVTPLGAGPFHAATSCAPSLMPLSDCSLIVDDLSEAAASDSDAGEAERV